MQALIQNSKHADLKTLKVSIRKGSEIKELVCSYVMTLDVTDQFGFCQTLVLSFNF